MRAAGGRHNVPPAGVVVSGLGTTPSSVAFTIAGHGGSVAPARSASAPPSPASVAPPPSVPASSMPASGASALPGAPHPATSASNIPHRRRARRSLTVHLAVHHEQADRSAGPT